MNDPFLRAMFAQPCAVLGQQLRPFSAFHLAALMVLENPLSPLASDRVATNEALRQAVWVCTLRYQDGGTSQIFPIPQMDAFNLRLPLVREEDYLQRELYAFEQYLEEAIDYWPQVWSNAKSKTRESGMPLPFHLVSVVASGLSGATLGELWDMPLSMLVAHKVGLMEQNGAEIETQRQRDLVAFKRQIEADAAQKTSGGESVNP